ncbi:hypothetical protein G9A89_001285 [Geosiphon pyriformis]|nr:hypothetical protein G9A89_001285 [Geosiphon pyriformis]
MNNLAKQDDIIRWHSEMGSLISIVTETKLKGRIYSWIMNKFKGVWIFTLGLDNSHLGVGVAIIMNNSLAQHVSKVSEVPGRLLSIRLLFKNKLSVSILGLYAGIFLLVWFFQADNINSIIAKAVNKTSFVILGGDFNENRSHRCVNFRKCFELGLVNFLGGSFFVKLPTWCNSHGVTKMIDYVFVSSNLVNAIVDRNVMGVIDFFDTDHKAVSVSVDLDGLLDQANKDHWKFDINNVNAAKWLEFKDASAANASMFSDNVVCKIMVISAGETFQKKWFKGFDSVFNKMFSKFHKLKLLVSKLVKSSRLVSGGNFALLLDTWDRLDSIGASSVKSLFLSGSSFDSICSELAKVRKFYRSFKLLESKCAGEAHIRQAIKGGMESFEMDKEHTIRSVLKHPFHKMVLDHLVVDDELVLEPELVKSKVNKIMEGWTRKRVVVSDISNDWMAGLSGISNKLWKHCDRRVLDMFLVLLNSCLKQESVSEPWKEAWVSMIPKPYEWEDIFTNIHPIVLIEMARKILFKIFLNRISLACSKFDVLREDNFSVLKGTMTQSPIFAIESVVEDALEKNRKLLVRIKMCNWFIRFFGSIHNGRTNRVMTDFGLTDATIEVFLPLLWQIFYDLLLCKIKKQESLCGYRLIFHFISKTGHVKPQAGLTSFLAAGAFVDDTIWIGSSQAATQYILNVANKFFRFNDISINNDKTIAIPINYRVYLGIFLSSEGLSKPSLAKAYSDIRFFVNFVLRKAISDKQFAYLVSAVLFLIISYRTQFSFVSINVCAKWDSIVHKCLKFKSGLLLDFLNNAVYHPSLYTESKSASIITFANSVGTLGYLFSHRSHDFQALSWHPRHPLLFPAHINVNPLNNFLAGMVCIFSGCDLSLDTSFASVFCLCGGTLMSFVFGEKFFFKCVSSLKHYGVVFVDQLCNRNGVIYDWKSFKCWKRLDTHGPVLFWFDLSVWFLNGAAPSSACSSPVNGRASSDICLFHDFGVVCDDLLATNVVAHLSVYMNGSLSGLDTVNMKTGATVFFEDINSGLGVKVSGLVSSMLMKLQAIALALECVPSFYSVDLFSDSQAALDACKAESLLVCPDFRNQCWIEQCYIANIVYKKNLDVNWVKVKGHSGILSNEWADMFARITAFSSWQLPHVVSECFLRAGGFAVSGNSRHFVCEIGSGSRVVVDKLFANIDWSKSSLVWHLDFHLATGFTNAQTAGFQTYFMKALYHRLPVAVYKRVYNRCYPSVMCLFCGDVEISDHVFSCLSDAVGHAHLADVHFSSCVLQLLFTHFSDVIVGTALCKGFVFCKWYHESVSIFKNPKVAAQNIVAFVSFMEKGRLILCDDSVLVAISGFSSVLLAGVVRLLGIADAFGVGFGYHRHCLFFSGIRDEASVHIGV